MRRSKLSVVMLLIVALSACSSPKAVVPVASSADAGLPAGWRWESYGGVQVGVPGDWGWGNNSQRLHQWCVATEAQNAVPIVGRTGYQTLVGCPDESSPRPATLIRNTGSVVGFEPTTQPPGVHEEGDQTAVTLNGVLVTVNAPVDLRRRIVETIRQEDVDTYGCPSTHPISTGPWHRPARPVAVTALRDVSTVTVCTFRLGRVPVGTDPRLISAMRLDGTVAAQAIQGIAAAPLGDGPNYPEQCLPRVSYGDEGAVLLVRSASGVTEIVFRHSGCDHHGFDDGVAVRKLTDEAIAPFSAGPNGGLRMPMKMPIR
jgi:hypothetical protein